MSDGDGCFCRSRIWDLLSMFIADFGRNDKQLKRHLVSGTVIDLLSIAFSGLRRIKRVQSLADCPANSCQERKSPRLTVKRDR